MEGILLLRLDPASGQFVADVLQANLLSRGPGIDHARLRYRRDIAGEGALRAHAGSPSWLKRVPLDHVHG